MGTHSGALSSSLFQKDVAWIKHPVKNLNQSELESEVRGRFRPKYPEIEEIKIKNPSLFLLHCTFTMYRRSVHNRNQ